MKKTVKVSLGGIAFVLEEDAYQILNDYLNKLKKYFASIEGGNEIINDIEARMSELLQMQQNSQEVITAAEALSIINIMGNPRDIADAQDPELEEQKTKEIPPKNEYSQSRKKLFRDGENSILGGVCSGLGHYFKTDPVIIRLIWIIVLCTTWAISVKAGLSIILLYFLLWIITPKAKSMIQKLSMKGTNPSIENIQEKDSQSKTSYRGSGLVEILRIILNIFIFMIAITIFLMSITTIASFVWFNYDSEVLGMNYILNALGINLFNFKACLLIFILLPMIGILYGCYKIIVRSSINSREWIVSLIAFSIWILSGLYLGVQISDQANMLRHETTVYETQNLATTCDTLYVQYPEIFTHKRRLPEYSNIFAVTDSENKTSLTLMPHVQIEEDTTISNFIVDIEIKSRARSINKAIEKAKNGKLNLTDKDSLLIINPPLYNNTNNWDGITYNIKIKTPKGKAIVITDNTEYMNFPTFP